MQGRLIGVVKEVGPRRERKKKTKNEKKVFFLKYDVHGYRRYNGIQRISLIVIYFEPISVLELLDRRFTFVSVNSDPVCITPNLHSHVKKVCQRLVDQPKPPSSF